MNLPIPAISEFLSGFASCAVLIVAAVLVRHAWPTIKGFFVKAETIAYAEYKAAVQAVDAKLNALSNAAAGAINTVRGDVSTLKDSIAALEDRAFTLEKAVGVADPTVDPKPVNPPGQGTPASAAGVPLHS